MANYNVDIDVAVRGYNRVEQNLKKLDQLIGKPRTFEISPFINVRKFRREQQKLLREMRRTGAESAVAFQEAFEREMARNRRIASMTAGAGSRTLPAAAGPIALLPATAVGQFQKAANAAKVIDASFANAKRSIDSITNRLALPPGSGGIAGLLPPAGGTGGGGGAIVPSGAGEFPFRGGRGGFRFAPDMTLGRGRGLFSRIDENRRSAALTGGAFPLLFGGGFGQAAGGAIGGLFSGKLFGGLTVALQVAGMAVDSMVNSTLAFGSSLGETDTALQSMTERSLFSTKATQERAEELQALGKTEELAKLLTAELASTIGTEGVKAFKDLGDESSEFNTLVNKLFVSLQALVAGPLAGFLSLVNSVLGRDISEQTVRTLKGSLQTPEGVAAFEKRVKEIAGIETRTIIRGQGVTETETVTKDLNLDQISQLLGELQEGKFGATDLLANRIDPSKPDVKKPKGRAARRSRIPELNAELEKLKQLLGLEEQINRLKLADDEREVIRLQGQARMLDFAVRMAALETSKAPEAEKEIERQIIQLELDRQRLENAFRLDAFDKKAAEEAAKKLELFNEEVDSLDAQLAIASAVTREEEEQARLQEILFKLRTSNKEMTDEQLQVLEQKTRALFALQNKGPLQTFIDDSTRQLTDLEEHAVQVSQSIGNAIGNSLTNGLANLISGAESAEEVFVNMLRSIADALAEQATQMISTYIAIGIARIFAGIGGGGGNETTPPTTLPGASVQTGPGLNINGVDQFIAPAAMASAGGYFDGPTRAVVGEGGEPEYVIPQSKMRESIARYSRGARGSAVIPDSGASGTSGEGGGTAVAAPIDVRFNVERINNVDYVTAEEFQIGMQKAAAQGAQRGQQLALTRLQQSPNTRRRLGL